MELTIGKGKKQTLKEKYGPLCKIVREEVRERRGVGGYTYSDRWEVLECGHELPQKRDIYGFTNATRRRCYKCK